MTRFPLVALARPAACAAAIALPLTSAFSLAIAPAHAAIQTYDIRIDVTAGSLEGNQFVGTVCYDDEFLMGLGTEEINPYLGLSVTMDFLGKDYDQTADTDYPEFPKLIFENGEIQRIEFWVESDQRGSWWNTPGWDIQLIQRERFEPTFKSCS